MTNTPQIETTAAEFVRLLSEVIGFTSHNDTIPALDAVGFESNGSDLLALATDRYTLGIGRLPTGGEHVIPHRGIRRTDAELIVSTFRQPKKAALPVPVRVDFGDEGLAVQTTRTLDGEPTLRVACPWVDLALPKWQSLSLFPDVASSSGPVMSALNPDFLARFIKLQRANLDPFRVTVTAHNKPWRVDVGDYFTGLIMPLRLPDSAIWTPAPSPSETPDKPKSTRRKRAAA